jgi:hypothetical protein
MLIALVVSSLQWRVPEINLQKLDSLQSFRLRKEVFGHKFLGISSSESIISDRISLAKADLLFHNTT